MNSYKIFLRQELSLAYGLVDPNDHVTAYLVHNQSRGKTGFLGSRELARDLQYRQRDETIAGVTYYKADAGPFPDPATGYKVEATQEAAGRFLDGDDDFTRTMLEVDRYVELWRGHKLAFRLKGGYGAPKDQYLFYLGNDTDLRGYDYKSVKGSSMLLGSVEYRFALARSLDARLPWNMAVCDEIQGVAFFDAGSAWFEPFNEPGFKKDAGFGLRFYFDVVGGVERVALRIDIAQPLNGTDKDTHIWVGVNHAF